MVVVDVEVDRTTTTTVAALPGEEGGVGSKVLRTRVFEKEVAGAEPLFALF